MFDPSAKGAFENLVSHIVHLKRGERYLSEDIEFELEEAWANRNLAVTRRKEGLVGTASKYEALAQLHFRRAAEFRSDLDEIKAELKTLTIAVAVEVSRRSRENS